MRIQINRTMSDSSFQSLTFNEMFCGNSNLRTIAFVLFIYCCTMPAMAQPYLVIKNVNVIDVRSGTFRQQSVFINGHLIEKLTPSGIRIDRRYQQIDGTGKFLIPGLINCYTHIHEFNTSLYLLHGITTVRDAPSMGHLPGLARKIKAGEIIGPEIFLTGNALSGVPTAFPTQDPLITEKDARAAVRETKEMGYESVFVYGSMTPAVYPFILDEARRQNIFVTGHFPSQVGIDGVITGAQRSYDNLSGLVRNGAWRYDTLQINKLFDDMVKIGRYLIPTLTVHKARANSAQVNELLKQERMNYVSRLTRAEWSDLTNSPFIRPGYNYAGTKRLLQHAHKKGVTILPGSDGGFPLVVDGFAFVDELKNLSEIGLSNKEIIAAATIKAAEFMNWQARIGLVEAGKEADLVVLNKNPLENIEHITSIEGVMINGRWMPSEQLKIEAEKQRERMNNQVSPIPKAANGLLLEISKMGVKIGEELIRIDTVGQLVKVRSHNFIEGPYGRESISHFYFSNNRADSLSVEQVRVDGSFKFSTKIKGDSIAISGVTPYNRKLHLTHPTNKNTFFLAGPMQGWHIPSDVWINYYLIAKRALGMSDLATVSVPVLQIELNSEEFGDNFIYDVERYRITKLEPESKEVVQILITQPAAQGEAVTSFNAGGITVVVTFDKNGNVQKLEANTVNGKFEALVK